MTGPSAQAGVMTSPRARSLTPDLAELLRTGPFEDALRAAIRASRLSLERIQHRLHARGTPVSVTALSYWQSGRRRPERPDSLLALRQLEAVLGVPDGALSALLGPPRPRGRTRRTSQDVPPLSALWPNNRTAAELLAHVDTSADGKLSRLSHHDVVHIDAHGNQRKTSARQLVRAECDGADRWITVFDGAASQGASSVIRPLRACHLGRVLTDPQQDVLVAELLFDRALNRDETILLEYDILHPPNEDDYTFCRLFRLPVRQYLLEARFDPTSRPARCESFVGDPNQTVREAKPVPLDRYGRTHTVAMDFGMGVVGMRWQPAPSAPPNPVAAAPF